MNNTLLALETLGKTAGLNQLQTFEIEQVINPLDLDPQVQYAIVNKDTAALEMLLNARNKIVCMVNKPEPDELPSEPQDDEDDTPEQEQAIG
jgi:hypothetical protein